MNEAWKRMAKNYIDCYEAINTLSSSGILHDLTEQSLKDNLLKEIIDAFRSDVEE